MNIDDLPGAGQACVSMEVQRARRDAIEPARDHVAEEVPIALVYNGEPFAVMLGTPLDLEDFALGFSWTEGVIASLDEFQGVEVEPEEEGFSVYVSVPRERVEALAARRRSLTGRTGCGLCGIEDMKDAIRMPGRALPDVRLSPQAVAQAYEQLPFHQPMSRVNRTVHAAAWCSVDGEIILSREDVGRHNALDKLVGALALAGRLREPGFVIMTSRCSYELVAKCAHTGAQLLATWSAPTALALRWARAVGLPLLSVTRAEDGVALVSFPPDAVDEAG